MSVADSEINGMRRFNRFYTRLVGALDEGHLSSEFSLAEVRVLFELANGNADSAKQLAEMLHLDAGYLSRILAKLISRKYVRASRSPDDARERELGLTAAGRKAFSRLDSRARDVVSDLLTPLGDEDRTQLGRHMQGIQKLLGDESEDSMRAVVLREHRPGDMGWVIERHGALYWREYQWDERFEALVARICADFVDNMKPKRERCWIAELEGTRVGSVFLVQHPARPDTAKLRLLLVDPSARGAGVGRTLVRECTRFARDAGYRSVTLWTNDVLVSARKLYQAEGYVLIEENTHRSFGHELVGQNWELVL